MAKFAAVTFDVIRDGHPIITFMIYKPLPDNIQVDRNGKIYGASYCTSNKNFKIIDVKYSGSCILPGLIPCGGIGGLSPSDLDYLYNILKDMIFVVSGPHWKCGNFVVCPMHDKTCPFH